MAVRGKLHQLFILVSRLRRAHRLRHITCAFKGCADQHIAPTAEHQDLGVQNHFSLGVTNANAVATKLREHGAAKFDGPEIGRDGKNSIDIYDPDLSRVEIMDFAPTKTPCCHAYTADHPKP